MSENLKNAEAVDDSRGADLTDADLGGFREAGRRQVRDQEDAVYDELAEMTNGIADMHDITPIYKIVNPSTGKTTREENLERKHRAPIGSLVEMINDPRNAGVRLYVVSHYRDCDGSPLYALCHDRNDTTQTRAGFLNDKWVGGIPEDSIRIIVRPFTPNG